MMKLLLLISLLFSTHIWSKDFEIEGRKFSVVFGENWVDTEGLFDIPLTLSGPMSAGVRPIISITPTEMTKVQFITQDESVVNKDYQEQRIKWLSGHRGVVQEFYPYQKTKWEGVEEVHSLGFRYVINETTFTEKTYYVICRERLYHLKSLAQSIHDENAEEIEGVVRSFRCQN